MIRWRSPTDLPRQEPAHQRFIQAIALGFTLLILSVDGTKAVAQEVDPYPSADEPYSLSYTAGGYDTEGHFMGGTEFLNLAAFNGELYGGIGYWEDVPDFFPNYPDPASGPQILVLESATSAWRQEFVFDETDSSGKFLYQRVSSMGVVQFHTFDNAGNETGVKAELLLAALDVPNGALYVQMSPGKWVNLKVPSTMSIRTFAVHHNPSSNVEKLYVGNGINGYGKGSIYSGTYDPTSSSIIQWDSMPLISGLPDRVMSMVNCDGMFFAADKPSIYRYHDQTNTFDVLYSFPLINAWDKSKYTSGFRALTCIDDPAQPGKKMLLTGFEGVQGDIFLIDPITGAAQVELDTRQLLQQKWGEAVASSVRDIIPGYSRMLSVTTEAGATKLIGLQAQQGVLNDNVIQGEKFSAWFLSCAQGGCDPGDAPNFNQRPYRLHQVPAPLSWPYLRSDKELWSIRTIAVSPFPEDQGQVLYLGGYDGHFAPGHNTAWLYRVGVDTALGAGAAPPNGGP